MEYIEHGRQGIGDGHELLEDVLPGGSQDFGETLAVVDEEVGRRWEARDDPDEPQHLGRLLRRQAVDVVDDDEEATAVLGDHRVQLRPLGVGTGRG